MVSVLHKGKPLSVKHRHFRFERNKLVATGPLIHRADDWECEGLMEAAFKAVIFKAPSSGIL